MTIRRLAVLQWLGLLFGAGTWALTFILGYVLAEAECSPAGPRWSVGHDAQSALTGVSALCVLTAGAAAVTVTLRTRGVRYDGDLSPLARIRFFAIAAIAANACFLVIIVLSGFAAAADIACRQA